MNRVRPYSGADEVLHVLTEVVEHIEVLWERSREASPAPLSASQLRAMFVLERAGRLNLRGLSESLDSAPSSVSRLCDRLEAVGFLERSSSSSSRREVELRLSERGRVYLADLRARREECLRRLIEELPVASRSALVEGLVSLRGATGARLLPEEFSEEPGTQSA